MIIALAFFFIFIATLLVLVVLVQRGRGGGLSGAFGAGGGTTAAFGTKTGDVFTTLTVVLFVVFMLLAIWLNFKFRPAEAAATAPAVGQNPSDLAPMGAPAVPANEPAPTTNAAALSTPTSAPASQPR